MLTLCNECIFVKFVYRFLRSWKAFTRRVIKVFWCEISSKIILIVGCWKSLFSVIPTCRWCWNAFIALLLSLYVWITGNFWIVQKVCFQATIFILSQQLFKTVSSWNCRCPSEFYAVQEISSAKINVPCRVLYWYLCMYGIYSGIYINYNCTVYFIYNILLIVCVHFTCILTVDSSLHV